MVTHTLDPCPRAKPTAVLPKTMEPSWHHRSRTQRSQARTLLRVASSKPTAGDIRRLEEATRRLQQHHGSAAPSPSTTTSMTWRWGRWRNDNNNNCNHDQNHGNRKTGKGSVDGRTYKQILRLFKLMLGICHFLIYLN